MFFIDIKDSQHEFRIESSRVKYINFLIKLSDFCKLNSTEDFNYKYGHKQGCYMRVGDGVAIIIDIRKHDIDRFRKIWMDFYTSFEIDFHSAGCYVEDLTGEKCIGNLYFGYAFPFLEDSLKSNIIMGEDMFFEKLPRKMNGMFLDILLDKTMSEMGVALK